MGTVIVMIVVSRLLSSTGRSSHGTVWYLATNVLKANTASTYQLINIHLLKWTSCMKTKFVKVIIWLCLVEPVQLNWKEERDRHGEWKKERKEERKKEHIISLIDKYQCFRWRCCLCLQHTKLLWQWEQHIPLKCLCLPTELRGIKFVGTFNFRQKVSEYYRYTVTVRKILPEWKKLQDTQFSYSIFDYTQTANIIYGLGHFYTACKISRDCH